jgi:hypothetical protein
LLHQVDDLFELNVKLRCQKLIVKYSIYVRLSLDDRHKRKIHPTSVRDAGIQICALEDSQGPTHGIRVLIVFILCVIKR